MSKSAKISRSKTEIRCKTAHGRLTQKSASKNKTECILDFNFDKVNSTGVQFKPKKSHPLAGKEIVRIVTRDGVRDLLVPSKAPNNIYPEVWHSSELERLKSQAKVETVEDRMKELQKQLVNNQKLKEESERRKQKLREIDIAKVAAHDEAKILVSSETENNAKLLDRAYLARQEQEEEVKKANRIILATKCHIIRDAQIAEKNEIAREFRENDAKLEKMMLVERDKALLEEELKREEERKNVLKYSEEIKKQLKEREIIRRKEIDRIEEEALMMQKALVAIEKDEAEKIKQRQEKTKKIQEELQDSSKWVAYFKNKEFEKERIAELKIQEYMRQKQEREKQIALEKRLAKEEKDKEYTKILQKQQKLLESMTEKSELEYRRQREQVEREFRRREKEAAIKRRMMDNTILQARAVQLEEMKRQRALQQAREEADFKSLITKLKEEKELEEKREKMRRENKYAYRDEIVGQMTEKLKTQKEIRDKQRMEEIAAMETQKQREENIKNVIKNKIMDMKLNKVPEKFIKDVERQLKISV